MPLARVVNTTKIKIQAEVPERNSTEIKLGASSISTFDAVPGDTVSGMVTFVGSTVSAVNHTVMVEIILTNPNGKLKSDMIAKTKLLREAKNNAILISEDMIQLVDRDRLIVFVDHNGTAQERRLTLGGRQGNRVEVVSGLRAGDRLIVVGYQKLVDGTPINVIQ
jgi:RND family efflux transporter MFP subunit